MNGRDPGRRGLMVDVNRFLGGQLVEAKQVRGGRHRGHH